ncbi:MAG: FKBP-type peptidyl-prolyl cis-trans isomerase [Candidatus Hydrogenedentota bacterium]
MKYSVTKQFTLAVTIAITSITAVAQDDAPKPDLKLTGYAIGQQFGGSLKDAGDLFDLDSFMKGFEDARTGKERAYTEQECQVAMTAFRSALGEIQQAVAAEAASKNKDEGIDFLADNAKRDGVTVLPSGLQYEVIEKGTGKTPVASDTVIAHYRGTFLNGEEFDSSYSRGEPSSFPVTRVIAGWTEALQLMKVGAKWKLFIPYELAYGEQGNRGIPGGTALLFDIELVDIQ